MKPSRLGAIAMQALALILLGLGCARAQYSSCPEAYGLQLYPHEQYCDKFYKCANGELLYFQMKGLEILQIFGQAEQKVLELYEVALCSN